MRIPAINSQAFKGLLTIPNGIHGIDKSKELEVETDDIIAIDNTNHYNTKISYIDRKSNEFETHKYYHNGSDFERIRILLAYAAAAANKDVIVHA